MCTVMDDRGTNEDCLSSFHSSPPCYLINISYNDRYSATPNFKGFTRLQPRAKSGWLSVLFVNKVLLEHSYICLFTDCLRKLSCYKGRAGSL